MRKRIHPFVTFILFILVSISLGINAFLIYRLSRVQADVIQMVRQTDVSLKALEGETITYTVKINQQVPIVAQVPINETFNVPISTTVPIRTNIPIRQSVDIPLNVAGLQLSPLQVPIDVNVPVDVQVPVNLSAPVHLDQSLAISTSVPLNLDVPIVIPLAQTPLAGYLRQLRQQMDRLDLETVPITP